jgi:PLP dependent protein
MTIQDNINRLLLSLPQDRPIKLVAVSKYASTDQMIEAYEAGLRCFGESRVQDLIQKYSLLPLNIAQNIEWHFIGHLQQNKVKKAMGLNLSLIHSIDSVELAQKLSDLHHQQHSIQDILLQVNLTREPQKFGFLEEDLWTKFSQLMDLPGIRIQGLMTIGPHTDDVSLSKACFQSLHDLRNKLEDKYHHALPELSMGMTQDYIHAIECGATIIRLGTLIFSPPPSKGISVQ